MNNQIKSAEHNRFDVDRLAKLSRFRINDSDTAMIKKELEILTEFADTVLTEMTVCAETYSTVAEFIEGHTAREDNETEHRQEHNEENLLSLSPTTENGYISVPKVISIN